MQDAMLHTIMSQMFTAIWMVNTENYLILYESIQRAEISAAANQSRSAVRIPNPDVDPDADNFQNLIKTSYDKFFVKIQLVFPEKWAQFVKMPYLTTLNNPSRNSYTCIQMQVIYEI